jgi:hypothetical protein
MQSSVDAESKLTHANDSKRRLFSTVYAFFFFNQVKRKMYYGYFLLGIAALVVFGQLAFALSFLHL